MKLLKDKISQGDELVKQGNLDEAIPIFSEALKIHPNSVGCLAQLARIYESKKEYHRAVEYLQKVVKIHPDPTNFQYTLDRINTPCIADSMKSSRFEKGLEGVYTEEWTKHGHINVLTRGMLEEMATIVGYSNILFNSKGGSVSGVKFIEYRPGPDRHQLTGNIFADLMK